MRFLEDWRWKTGLWLAGDAVSVLAWDTGAAASVLQEFAVPLCVGAMIVCTTGLLIVLHDWHRAQQPASRFRQLTEMIELTVACLEADHPNCMTPAYSGPPGVTSSETKAFLIRLVRGLDGLDVPHPPFDYKVDRWLVFLSRILADAHDAELAVARTRWNKMKSKDGDRDAPAG